MRNIEYRPRAEVDLDGIFVFLAFEVKAPQAAERVAEELSAQIELIAEIPTLGHSFEDEGLQHTYRRILCGSYWIYYTFDEATLTVWRIFHTSRDTDMFGYHIFDK